MRDVEEVVVLEIVDHPKTIRAAVGLGGRDSLEVLCIPYQYKDYTSLV